MSRVEITLLLLLLFAIVGGVALIPDDPRSQHALGQPSPVDWPAVSDNPDQKLDLSWMGIPIHIGGDDDAWIIRNLEERFNVDIAPVFMDSNGYKRRRPLLLVGGDVPDVMWDGDPLRVRRNLKNGFIMELPYGVILKHAPTYVGYLNQIGKEAWLYSHADGKNYGLPTFDLMAAGPRIGTWRADWLENVGIDKVPETIEEMGEALRRFREDDPDGNGDKDTYGWSPDVTHWSLAFAEIFAAFDTLGFDFIERDGAVVWGGVLPEAKEALAVMHRWYDADLLDRDFVLHVRKSGTEFQNGRVGYKYPVDHYFEYDPEHSGSLLSQVQALNGGGRMVASAPLRNAAGRRSGRTWGGAAHVMQFGKHLEDQPEKVVRVLKMLEAITKDRVLYAQARFGQRDEHWAFDTQRGRVTLPPYTGDKRLTSGELLPKSNFFFPSVIYDHDFITSEEASWIQAHRDPSWGLYNVLGKSDVVPSAGRYLGDLRNWQMTAFIEFVRGDRPLEAFDDFVAEWNRRGGDVLTREANAMFEQMKAIYAAVGVEGLKGAAP